MERKEARKKYEQRLFERLVFRDPAFADLFAFAFALGATLEVMLLLIPQITSK